MGLWNQTNKKWWFLQYSLALENVQSWYESLWFPQSCQNFQARLLRGAFIFHFLCFSSISSLPTQLDDYLHPKTKTNCACKPSWLYIIYRPVLYRWNSSSLGHSHFYCASECVSFSGETASQSQEVTSKWDTADKPGNVVIYTHFFFLIYLII